MVRLPIRGALLLSCLTQSHCGPRPVLSPEYRHIPWAPTELVVLSVGLPTFHRHGVPGAQQLTDNELQWEINDFCGRMGEEIVAQTAFEDVRCEEGGMGEAFRDRRLTANNRTRNYRLPPEHGLFLLQGEQPEIILFLEEFAARQDYLPPGDYEGVVVTRHTARYHLAFNYVYWDNREGALLAYGSIQYSDQEATRTAEEIGGFPWRRYAQDAARQMIRGMPFR